MSDAREEEGVQGIPAVAMAPVALALADAVVGVDVAGAPAGEEGTAGVHDGVVMMLASLQW